ncbi:MAG TPA: acyl-CoA dehydrogenase family protein [Candidatus Micrarchaeia archaeon]|nr:acyl-CoA dehydrogenase family protein [Candidatus Micrarchaeia archaeon]
MTPMTEEQQAIVDTVRDFVDREVIPLAPDLERRDAYPEAMVEGMRELGLFGLTVPEAYGGAGLDLVTYAMVVEELARGWMSLAGVLNTHVITAYLIATFGTDEQRQRFLPRLAAAELRAGFSMSEPQGGSDVQAVRTVAERQDDAYLVTGTKMWATNGARAGLVATLVRTDPGAEPPHRQLSCLLCEKGPGFTAGRAIDKLGYKGVETTELLFTGSRQPRANLLGGEEGRGFQQMMAGIEVGRINVAARAIGVARSAFEHAIRYARERQAFGRPIAEHQAIQFKLADMATQIEASRLLTHAAAQRKQRGERSDVEAGMAKLFSSEACQQVVLEAMRIFGGYGYATAYPIERLYRDAPLLIVGEGTNEIQRLIIARGLLARAAD